MELRVSDLETERLGVRVGRAEGVTAGDVPLLLEWAHTQALEFLIARTDAADAEAALALLASSARLRFDRGPLPRRAGAKAGRLDLPDSTG